jgi:hypothetical protein
MVKRGSEGSNTWGWSDDEEETYMVVEGTATPSSDE